jgi:hypothetical protein
LALDKLSGIKSFAPEMAVDEVTLQAPSSFADMTTVSCIRASRAMGGYGI